MPLLFSVSERGTDGYHVGIESHPELGNHNNDRFPLTLDELVI